jgi:hypothetical protein
VPPTILLFGGLLALLILGVAFVVPAGYGLPGPVFGVIALVGVLPGLFVGWLIYRYYVDRGQVPRLGTQLPEAAQDDEDRETVVAPNAERAHEQVSSFRRAAGEEPADEPLTSGTSGPPSND